MKKQSMIGSLDVSIDFISQLNQTHGNFLQQHIKTKLWFEKGHDNHYDNIIESCQFTIWCIAGDYLACNIK